MSRPPACRGEGAGGAGDAGHDRLVEIVRGSTRLMTVLEVVRKQALPDSLVFSGAIYQTVWNSLTDRHPDYGIKDYDVGYFDPDLSFDAEDRVIRRVASAVEGVLRGAVEVRNQARVHLWFPGKFGHAYAPLGSTAEALTRFVCPAFAVGVRLEDDGSLAVVAPLGLEDCFDLRLRENPLRGPSADWDRIVGSALARWPELTVTPPTRTPGELVLAEHLVERNGGRGGRRSYW